jgi:glycosyltransferase involved in cell wall biosynthesis
MLYVISVVVPALNEERSIGDIIERTLSERKKILSEIEEIKDFEFIVVNDGSTDRTGEIVRGYADEVILIEHERNMGYGFALKRGFQAATGDLIAFYDGDRTYPPECLSDLIKKMIEKDADVVIGSRMAGEKSDMPLQRRVGNKFFAYLLSWIVGRRISDTASGMRVFRKSILPQLYPLPDGLDLTPAMSTQALHENLKIVETPIAYDERVGSSKLNAITDGVRFLRTIIGVARLYNPLKFFGLIGLLFIVTAIVLSIGPISYYLQARRVEYGEIYRLFTIMVLSVTGLNVLIFGIVSNETLSIMHKRKILQNSRALGLFLRSEVTHLFGKLGWFLILISALLNYEAIFQFLTTRHIYVHWSYILTGTALFLVGGQLVMARSLLKVLRELRDRQRAGAHDE